ncbi:hypothetical protein HYPSUDRAFT_204624 [Hypholoma sublateritium FD-334 SS-4]|uniref:Uncharacterized protein n=1 Tax=Hypholoma sublateritium (strain FD-334 SS-4) TaxID=945553 RepID=A0A0D2PH36_HYPSF|nr:hypothetical protein HYPSUDRAFT_204624 [Hypholoma sublateritium FD-334 SS-4]
MASGTVGDQAAKVNTGRSYTRPFYIQPAAAMKRGAALEMLSAAFKIVLILMIMKQALSFGLTSIHTTNTKPASERLPVRVNIAFVRTKAKPDAAKLVPMAATARWNTHPDGTLPQLIEYKKHGSLNLRSIKLNADSCPLLSAESKTLQLIMKEIRMHAQMQSLTSAAFDISNVSSSQPARFARQLRRPPNGSPCSDPSALSQTTAQSSALVATPHSASASSRLNTTTQDADDPPQPMTHNGPTPWPRRPLPPCVDAALKLNSLGIEMQQRGMEIKILKALSTSSSAAQAGGRDGNGHGREAYALYGKRGSGMRSSWRIWMQRSLSSKRLRTRTNLRACPTCSSGAGKSLNDKIGGPHLKELEEVNEEAERRTHVDIARKGGSALRRTSESSARGQLETQSTIVRHDPGAQAAEVDTLECGVEGAEWRARIKALLEDPAAAMLALGSGWRAEKIGSRDDSGKKFVHVWSTMRAKNFGKPAVCFLTVQLTLSLQTTSPLLNSTNCHLISKTSSPRLTKMPRICVGSAVLVKISDPARPGHHRRVLGHVETYRSVGVSNSRIKLVLHYTVRLRNGERLDVMPASVKPLQ